MNPSYMASMKATSTMILNAFLGIPHKPKAEKETSINGRAFAPGKGVQQEVSSEEKEVKVRAHLDKLASECKARYLDECSKYPYVEEHSYPRSDMVVLMEEAQAQREIESGIVDPVDYATAEQKRRDRITFNTKANAKVMTALYGADNACKIDETSTHEQVLEALHKDHAAYITRQIALNRTNYRETGIDTVKEPIEPKYPTSDLIDALHEHMAEQEAAEKLHAKDLLDETTKAFKKAQAAHGTPHWMPGAQRDVDLCNAREAASNACIHTGERMNLEETDANNGTKFEAQ